MSRDETARFLVCLTGQPDPAVRWQVFDDAKASRVRARHWHATLGEALPDLRAASEAGGGIFVAVNECQGGRKAENVRRVRALFVDIEPPEGAPIPAPDPEWHLPPSMVVHSVRGPHAYWLVDDCPLAEFEAAQRRLIAHYGSDPVIKDLARVMRVPGFPHQKAEPRLVTLHSVAEPRLVYHLSEILAGLAALPAPASSPPPTTRLAAPASGAAGDWATCDAVGLFRAAGLYRRALGPDKHAVVCPWESEHSSPGGDADTSTVLWEPAGGKAWPQFRCAHAHCDGREWRDVVAALGPATVAAHCGRPAWGLAEELPGLIESCYRDFEEDPRQVAQVGPPAMPGPDRGPVPTAGGGAEEWPKMVKGKPARDWPENTGHLLRGLGYSIRRNLMTQRIEIGSVTGRVLTYDDLLAEMETAARCRGYKLALRPLENHLRLEANAHAYHPVREWVEAGPAWDGRDRLDDLFGSLALAPEADPDLCRELVRVWLLSAAAMLDAVGTAREVSTQGVLVLVGPQGCGKTRWLKGLAPVGVLEGVSLDPDNRDSVERATHAWIVELGELDATFRADIAKLKAFVTVTTDTYRKAYGHAEATWPRRTAFCGSVNETKFLVDTTGNRRWWTVPVVGCEPYGLDRQQLWQQFLYEVRQPHARWWLDPATEDRLRVVNEGHEVPDPFLDAVEEMFEPSEAFWTKQTDIMEKVRQRFTGWGKPQINATAAALRRLGFTQRKIRGTRQWAVVPSPSYLPATRQDWSH